MCGRYVSATSAADVAREFEATAPPEPLAPDYNVAPTKRVYVVVDRPPRDGHEPGSQPDSQPGDHSDRSVEIARWGLVPSWAKDRSIGSRLINARAETVAGKPAYRRAFAKRRCLVPADGYYEWYQPGADSGPGAGAVQRTRKQPFYISRADGRLLALAGLYEWWRDEAGDPDEPWLLTCTVLTTSAPDGLGRIHDRMPMVLGADDWEPWLDRDHPGSAVVGLLRPAATVGLQAWPVSTRVNSVRNNDPSLIEPIPAEE